MSQRKWTSTIFKKENGQWLFFGMPVFGGWLPTAFFGTGISFDDVLLPTEKVTVKYFKMSWCLKGWAIIYSVEISAMFK